MESTVWAKDNIGKMHIANFFFKLIPLHEVEEEYLECNQKSISYDRTPAHEIDV